MRVKHIAFDIDGTLIDTRDLILESILACLPAAQRAAARKIALETAGMSPKEVLSRFGVQKLDAYWRHHSNEAKRARLFFEDTDEVLRKLRDADVSLSIITSLPARPATMLISNARLSGHFALLDTYGSRSYRKPSPKLLSLHLSDLGIRPEEAVYVGDSEGDMTMTKGAGAHAFAAGWGPTRPDDLVKAGADRVLKNLRELVQEVS